MSNLLAMPLVSMTVVTATNEDWIDSILFLVDGADPLSPQLDITGITFHMEVRRRTDDHEVVLRASNANGDRTITIGEPPNVGYLIINIDHETMKTQIPGQYVADIIGNDLESTRRCILIDLEIQAGVTRP